MTSHLGTNRTLLEGKQSTLPQVIIVGAGFGGIATAKFLRKTGTSITLIDQHNHHCF